ncbi:hypothetical protein Tco_0985975 [Tanacetum coccineum]
MATARIQQDGRESVIGRSAMLFAGRLVQCAAEENLLRSQFTKIMPLTLAGSHDNRGPLPDKGPTPATTIIGEILGNLKSNRGVCSHGKANGLLSFVHEIISTTLFSTRSCPQNIRIAKSQHSSNSTASSGSNPIMFQEMMQQQLEIERKEKMERIDREVNSRVALNDSKRVVEDLKVLQISTDGMDPIGAAIVNAGLFPDLGAMPEIKDPQLD